MRYCCLGHKSIWSGWGVLIKLSTLLSKLKNKNYLIYSFIYQQQEDKEKMERDARKYQTQSNFIPAHNSLGKKYNVP